MSDQQHGSPGVSVVIPAFDEEQGIRATVREILQEMDALDSAWEILVVDDGSQDRTGELAEQEGATVIRLPENHGYGAALKAGIRRARNETIVITDADGTYPAFEIPKLLEQLGEYDMVVGSRSPDSAAIPAVRRPAKWFLTVLAGYLAGRPSPT